jgi:hypothetical protein
VLRSLVNSTTREYKVIDEIPERFLSATSCHSCDSKFTPVKTGAGIQSRVSQDSLGSRLRGNDGRGEWD